MERALKSSKCPGAALAVVTPEGSYVRGYGVRAVGTETPVTESSRFGIASVTKGFTAAAIEKAVLSGKLNWDDPVRWHLPAFRLSDPGADAAVTIRDLLCHRTGLPRHDALWYRTSYSRAEILARIPHLKPTASFRGAYQYNNLCYLVAGEALAAAVGQSYETYLTEALFKPLGLDITFDGPGLTMADARPHRIIEKAVTTIEPLRFGSTCAGGGINASASDLEKWIRFQLSEERPKETHRPQMVQPLDDTTLRLYPDRIQQTYGLGWSIFDWQGQPVISHGGSIDGFRSHLTLLPRQKIGFAILINLGFDGLVENIRNTFLDQFLAGPHRDWWKITRDDKLKHKSKTPEKPKFSKPTVRLENFCGTYTDPGYGTVTIHLEEKLKLEYAGISVKLKHVTRDIFVCEDIYFAHELHFSMDKLGKVKSLTLFDQIFPRKAD